MLYHCGLRKIIYFYFYITPSGFTCITSKSTEAYRFEITQLVSHKSCYEHVVFMTAAGNSRI